MTIAQDITAARDSLTVDNWVKGHYFATQNHSLCMCAHGALQAQVNPMVANVIDMAAEAAKTAAEAAAGAEAATAYAAEAAAEAEVASEAAASAAERRAATAGARVAAVEAAKTAAELADEAKEMLYRRRPYWVMVSEDTGSLEAHYILGLVGLTSEYNDSPSTTLDDIKAKMTEAAALAESLGA